MAKTKNSKKRKRTNRSSHNLELLLALFGIVALCWTVTFFAVFQKSPSSDHDKFLLSPHNTPTQSIKRKTSEATTTITTTSETPKPKDEDYLLHILQQTTNQEVSDEDKARIPKWSTVKELYGPGPVIYGLDQCRTYREKVPETDRHIGPSGLFNTGTNVFFTLLFDNCEFPSQVQKYKNPQQTGMEWEVNWGKHVMPEFRDQHTIDPKHHIAHISKDLFLPVGMVRDPFSWMKSMCRHSYTLNWPHLHACPHLFDEKKGVSVKARYRTGPGVVEYDSILHVWNRFLNGYYKEAKYPFLMVRFEDLIFYAEDTIQQVCDCVGGTRTSETFKYAIESTKIGPGHGKEESRTGLVEAWERYGKPHNFSDISTVDLEYAQQHVDKDLVDIFGYNLGPKAKMVNARAALED